jgi:hypothetical protein
LEEIQVNIIIGAGLQALEFLSESISTGNLLLAERLEERVLFFLNGKDLELRYRSLHILINLAN